MALVRLLCLCKSSSWFWPCSLSYVKLCCIYLTDLAQKIEKCLDRPEEEEEEEEEELRAPDQEIELDMETITEDEKQAIPEFFEGRPSKTPERYLKIRNFILDQW